MTSLTDVILPHVPDVRRYAFLLTGSSRMGDALVERALRTIVESGRQIPSDRARTDLFRLFDRISGTITVGRLDPSVDPLIRHLQGLEPLDRRVLLLGAALGFADDEIASIVRRSVTEVAAAKAAARAALVQAAAGRVLVIEDDALIAAEIVDVVESMGEGVCGKAATFAEALRIAQSSRPSLVIADVQLGQQRQAGRDAALACIERFKSAVIFVTAYPERLLQGAGWTGQQPVLTKPCDRSHLERAITSALMPTM